MVLMTKARAGTGGGMFYFRPRDNTECVLCARHISIRGQGAECLPRALDRKPSRYNDKMS